jgi:dTMP kinase
MFIVLEGPDGAGTTLHTKLLSEKLTELGKTVLLTAEPTDGAIGKWIRGELESGKLTPPALQLLFCADRAEHISNTVMPALKRGEVVISDRYTLSTLAYGEASGIDRAWLTQVNAKFPKPDFTFLLLPPFEKCMERLARREEKDLFEKEEFQKKVHASYKHILNEHSELIKIDSSGEKADTAALIFNALHL